MRVFQKTTILGSAHVSVTSASRDSERAPVAFPASRNNVSRIRRGRGESREKSRDVVFEVSGNKKNRKLSWESIAAKTYKLFRVHAHFTCLVSLRRTSASQRTTFVLYRAIWRDSTNSITLVRKECFSRIIYDHLLY